MDDLVELVRGDHARIGRLFKELEEAADNPARLAELWTELAEVLPAHVGAYEEICQLPLRRAVPDGAPSTQDIDAQNHDIREAVAEARLQPVGSAQWWLAVRAAQAAADRHIDSVEAVSLPRFARLAPESTRRELGRHWKRYMADLSDDRRDGVCFD
jgi:Hemerythrin HHE cation binding domain